MANRIRHAILMALSLAMLAGCATSTSSGSTGSQSGTSKFPDSMNIYAYNIFNENVRSEDDIPNWNKYMSDKYDSQITLNEITQENYSNTNNRIRSGEVSGIVSLMPNYILGLIKTNNILPLDDYLKDNKVWNALPEDFRNQFMFNGHIWAIPRYDVNINAPTVSLIRSDWLTKTGKTVPTTQAELLEVGNAFAKGDPNGNGEKDEYLFGCYNAQIMDVLNSFGLYFSYNTSVAFDPTQDCIVDSLFKPEAKEALQYLRSMVTSGIIDPDSFSDPTINSKSSTGIYGTTLTTPGYRYEYGNQLYMSDNPSKDYSNMTEEDFKKAATYYEPLPPLSKTNPIVYGGNAMGFVLTSSVSDPKATVNAFADMAFGSLKNYLDCYIGESENYSVGSDGNITINYVEPDVKSVPAIVSLVVTPKLMLEKTTVDFPDNTVNNILSRLRREENAAYIERYTKTKQLYSLSAFDVVMSQTFSDNYSSLQKGMNNTFLYLLNPDKSIDEILTIYRTTAKQLQMEQILQEANENIGKVSKQVLDD